MNLTVNTTTKKDEMPICFGREWDKNSPECAGGADANYTHPKTGLHIREQCNFFQSCASRTQAQKNAQLMPPSALTRPAMVTPPPTPTTPAPAAPTAPIVAQPVPAAPAATPPLTMADYLRQQHAAQQEAQRQQAMNGARPMQYPHAIAQAPVQYPAPQYPPAQPAPMPYPPMQAPMHQQHPAPMYQLNYMMPAYLSTPEPRLEGESLWSVLGREMGRSVLKAAGHSVAHFFDTRTFKQRP